MDRGMSLSEDVQRMKTEVLLLRLDKVVLVEGATDKLFWADLLNTAIHGKYEIFPSVNHPTYDTTGKSALLKHYVQFTDVDFVICLDSDYDYLLEKPILTLSFVFQTYVYSIENYGCYAAGLPEMLKNITNTEGVVFDFVHFFETYSSIIYPYLLCSLFSTKHREIDSSFPILSRLELGKQAVFVTITDITANLTALEERLKTQYTVLLNQCTEKPAFEPFKNHLTDLGLTEKEAYFFVRGHDVLDKVAVPLMKNVVKKHFTTLSSQEEKIAYDKQIKTQPYEVVFQNNPQKYKCSFYQRIVQDIQTAFI